MILIGIVLIVAIIVGYKSEEWFVGIFFFSMGQVLVAMFSLAFASLQEVDRINHSVQLFSLRNDSHLEGSFFLGSGTIDQQEYYYTFYQDNRGGYRRWTIPIRDASLFMDSDKPYATYQTIVYRCPWWISFPFERTEDTRVDIHVPHGTIVEKYEVR